VYEDKYVLVNGRTDDYKLNRMGVEAPRMCSRLQGICRQTFGGHSKNKHKVEKDSRLYGRGHNYY
jgi:hypothetical protein